ncbi:MAG TPA: 4-hydroxyphenylpyruvate dioxygenase, partial [Rudaea sp.]
MSAQPLATAAGVQPEQFENPMGIDGFEFVEFASAEPAKLHELFRKMGFVQVARHKTRPIYNYRQNDATFLINEDPDSFAAD